MHNVRNERYAYVNHCQNFSKFDNFMKFYIFVNICFHILHKITLISGTYRPNLNTYATIDAVYVFAHALYAIHRDRCQGRSGVCAELENVTGQELMGYMKNVTFTGKMHCILSYSSSPKFTATLFKLMTLILSRPFTPMFIIYYIYSKYWHTP